MKVPSFGDLRECIQRSFSTSASYLPEVWTYWSKSDSDYYALPEEDTHEQAKIPRTRYVSHPYINLATLKNTLKSDEVSLITSCTSNKVTRGILITPEEWIHGIFQVVCFVPEKYHGGISYEDCVGVKYQIFAPLHIQYKKDLSTGTDTNPSAELLSDESAGTAISLGWSCEDWLHAVVEMELLAERMGGWCTCYRVFHNKICCQERQQFGMH